MEILKIHNDAHHMQKRDEDLVDYEKLSSNFASTIIQIVGRMGTVVEPATLRMGSYGKIDVKDNLRFINLFKALFEKDKKYVMMRGEFKDDFAYMEDFWKTYDSIGIKYEKYQDFYVLWKAK